jgi:hypothetical protein
MRIGRFGLGHDNSLKTKVRYGGSIAVPRESRNSCAPVPS